MNAERRAEIVIFAYATFPQMRLEREEIRLMPAPPIGSRNPNVQLSHVEGGVKMAKKRKTKAATKKLAKRTPARKRHKGQRGLHPGVAPPPKRKH